MTPPLSPPRPETPADAGRVAVVLSHPVQYYSPWFRQLTTAGWGLRVFYLWNFGVTDQHDPGFGRSLRWDVDLLTGYEHEFVPNTARDPGTHHFFGLRNPALPARLQAWRPDSVLLFGYKYYTHTRLILRSSWPLVFRGDSHLIDHPSPHGLKRWVLRRLYARIGAFTFVGEANRRYFRAFGVPENHLFFAPHAVDAERFTATPASRAEAARLRSELGIDGRRVVLFAGKLVPAKQPQELLEAFIAVGDREAALVFVGDGSEREALGRIAARHPDVAVRFLPFANQSEMPSRYLLADLFALPSRGLAETWALAVNESMHLGRPCLVSNRVGCQQDLVTDGVTGWVFNAADAPALRQALARALADSAHRGVEFSRAAMERVSRYSYATATTGLHAAVAAARKNRHSP